MLMDIIQGEQIVKLSSDTQIDLLVQGSGKPVMWLHSGFRGRIGLGNLISTVERKLNQADIHWRNIIPNLPGFGESTSTSSQNNNPYELTENIEELVTLLDYPSIDIIGFSLGANVASILVNRIPDRIRRVVLLGTAVEGRSLDVYRKLLELYDREDWEGIVNKIALSLVGRKNRRQYLKMMPLVKKQVASERFAIDLTRIVSSGVRLDIFNELEKIPHPTLMISGEDDPFRPTPKRLEVLQKKENIKLILLEGIGHNEMVFPRQIDLSDQILEFLED